MKLGIYDITGRLVSMLINQQLVAGNHEISWDGVDMMGYSVSAGMYIYTLESKSVALSRKMVLMK